MDKLSKAFAIDVNRSAATTQEAFIVAGVLFSKDAKKETSVMQVGFYGKAFKCS
jgi:hypothetical protein